MAFASCISLALAACSSDGPDFDDENLWEGEAETPKYVEDAAIYKVNSNAQCPFQSIELTESGDYIVTPSYGYSVTASHSEATMNRGMFRKHAASKSRADLSSYDYTYGTFTKNTDGSYNLDGLGTMTYSNGTLTLSLTDGTRYNVKATETRPTLASNDLNLRFCRTWYVKSASIEVYNKSGKKLDSYTYSGAELQEEFVQYVIFSRCGSYISVDFDGTVAERAYWSWTDTSKQIFGYSNEDASGGTMQVAFNGDKAKFKGSYTEYDDDYEQEVTIVEIVSCTSK